MAELHRNQKILIIAVLAVIASYFFLRWIFYFLIGFSILVLLPGYFIYKSIRKKIENFGNRPAPGSPEEFKANVAKAKARQNALKHPKGAYGKHPFTGGPLRGRAAHRRRFGI